MGPRRFIVFELNEVPLRVVRHFEQKNPDSTFAKLLRHGQAWQTRTPDEGHLSPWITWPTLHRGVSGQKHQLIALGQEHIDADREYPPVWRLLAAAGRHVGVFGSLHSYPLPPNAGEYAFYVPDTFASGPETEPPGLSAFQKFNLQMVDQSGRNVSTELPLKAAVEFLLQSLPSGIRPATLAKIARQVAMERFWPHRKTRRRTIQSLLAFDIFLAQLKTKQPDGAFFFTNHVASSMHRYWPATFTADYTVTTWPEDWVRRFSGEIDYTMFEADAMLAELIGFADRNPEYVILVCSSMGQAAVDDPGKRVTTQVLVRDIRQFVGALGIESAWVRRRTMEPTYTISFVDEAGAEEFMAAIAHVKLAGRPVESRRLDAHGIEFVLGQYNLPDAEFTLTIKNHSVSPANAGLANVAIEDEVASAAYHVPEGVLLCYDPTRRQAAKEPAQSISSTRIAPTLLALQGLPLPHYMEEPLEEILQHKLEVV